MKKTPLWDRHQALGAKMVEFSGWSMPIQYEGILSEHAAVREKAGVFDVSHMGRVRVLGAHVLENLSVSHIDTLKPGKVRYTVWCNERGGTIDDLIVYRLSEEEFFVVCNASNCDKDLAHLLHHGANATPLFDEEGILALQGPLSEEIAASIFQGDIPKNKMEVNTVLYKGAPVILSTTGYTGSGGYEVFAKNELLESLFDDILAKGAAPIGLGARDTLRLEKGYALYGHELSEEISPLESVSAWAVKPEKEFFGKEALLARKRRFPCSVLLETGIAREGAKVFLGENQVGVVTSGTFSPTLKKGIALLLLDCEVKDGLEIEVRGKRVGATQVPLPFVE